MSTESRERIVAAARRAFYERGFDETSFADLATISGIPKGNFYYHFRSKADLLVAVLEARSVDIARALARWAETLHAPGDRLKRFVRMMTAEQEDLARYGCPLGSLLTELGKKHEALHTQVVAILEMYVAWLAVQFATTGRSGASARRLAVRLVSRCQGAVVLAHAYHDPKVLQCEVRDIERWIDQKLGRSSASCAGVGKMT